MAPLWRAPALKHEALVELDHNLDQRADLGLDVGAVDPPVSRRDALDRKAPGHRDRIRIATRLEPLSIALAREVSQVLVAPIETHPERAAQDAIPAAVVAHPAIVRLVRKPRVPDDHEIASRWPHTSLNALSVSGNARLPAQSALGILDDLKRRAAAPCRAAPSALAALDEAPVHQMTGRLEADKIWRVARAHLGRDGLVAIDACEQLPGRLVLESHELPTRASVLG